MVSAGRTESFPVQGFAAAFNYDHCSLTRSTCHGQAQWLGVCLENLKAGGKDFKEKTNKQTTAPTHRPLKTPPLGLMLSLAACFWPAPWNK